MPEPITLAEAKQQIRGAPASDDALITGYIVAARELVEEYTGLVLTRRDVTESLSGFGCHTRLRAWPIDAESDVTIDYRDTAGVDQTIATAVLRNVSRPALLYPALNTVWPVSNTIAGPIAVTFTAGFETPGDVPQKLKQAMLVLITALYEDREGGEMLTKAEAAAARLCRGWKRRTL